MFVRSSIEDKRDVSSIRGGTWKPKARHWVFPKSAIFKFFSKISIEKIEYTEDVLRLFEIQKRNISYLKAIKRRWEKFVETGEKAYKHEFLMEHQNIAVAISKRFSKFAYFLDTGKLPCPLQQ